MQIPTFRGRWEHLIFLKSKIDKQSRPVFYFFLFYGSICQVILVIISCPLILNLLVASKSQWREKIFHFKVNTPICTNIKNWAWQLQVLKQIKNIRNIKQTKKRETVCRGGWVSLCPLAVPRARHAESDDKH